MLSGLVVLALAHAPAASATKYFDSFFGATGTTGGLFGGVGDVAVNYESFAADGGTHAGWIYVVDRSGNRVQAFDAAGAFQWAIGRDVVQSGGVGDTSERQMVTVEGSPTGGTFTLTFGAGTTAPIPFDADASTVQTELEGLAAIGVANVSVTGSAGGPYTVDFVGARASVDHPPITGSGAGLSPSGSVVVATEQDGASFEKCTVVTQCKAGATTTTAGTSLGNAGTFSVAQGIDVDQETGHFFVSERATSTSGSGAGNRRVQEFTADGTFVRAFGFGVVQSGPGDVNVVRSERQTVTLAGAFGPLVSGTFTLTFDGQTTAPMAFNASAAAVESSLEALTSVGEGGVEITGAAGGPYTVDFTGPLADSDQPTITGSGASLVDAFGLPGAVTVVTVVPGGPGPDFETCNAAAGDICQPAAAGGSFPGQFGNSTQAMNGVAVAPPGAPNAGAVYVADPANGRILPFAVPASPTGTVVAGSPIGTSGMGDNEFGGGWPRDVAADARGVVYGSNTRGSNSGMVYRYDTASEEFLEPLESTTGNQILGFGPISGLEVDHDTGNLLVGRPAATGVVELEMSDRPATIDPSLIADTHGALLLGSATSGSAMSAIGAGNDRMFVATSTAAAAGTGTGQRVLVLDTDGIAPPPSTAIGDPTAVGSTTATLRAAIDPVLSSVFRTSYRWQASKTGVDGDWIDLTEDRLVGGDGFTPESVADQVTGLEPNTLYRIRVRTLRDPAAGVTFSSERVLMTDPDAVAVTTDGASRVTADSAQLNGRVVPGGLISTYWFEWGDDGYGHRAPVPAATVSGTARRTVGQVISGLSSDSVYHYRLCAQNSLSAAPTCGQDQVIHTRRVRGHGPLAERAYELVTSPDKALRRGGERGGVGTFSDYSVVQGALPSPDGEAMTWSVFAGVTDPQSGAGFAHDRAWELRRRTGSGWLGEAVTQISPTEPAAAADSSLLAISANLRTQSWFHQAAMFRVGIGASKNSMHVVADGGGPRGGGWYPWLADEWFSGGEDYNGDAALIDDTGARAVRWHWTGRQYRDLRPVDDTVTPSGLTPPQTSGAALFLTHPGQGWTPSDLISECTGTGADATLVPARIGSGLATDIIGARDCELGSPTSVRGARLGGGGQSPVNMGPLAGTITTAMSADGRRVFFQSPDAGPTACATGTGSDTDCPPQLFVRQYDSDGSATTRWISRAVPELRDTQQIGLMGAGVSFEGASRDGSVVYFRTNAPLSVDDPNGAGVPPPPGGVSTGNASKHSWDLYRYELPDLGDPGDGTLERVTGGSDGTADPNTNCAVIATSGEDSGNCSGSDNSNVANGAGGAVRAMSDDGGRVYFVTAGRIAGADNDGPAGGITSPTAGESQVNASARNLYLYDAAKSGPAAYRFVARLPFGTGGPDSCASYDALYAGPSRVSHPNRAKGATSLPDNDSSCVRGTSSGDAIAFETTGRLTADDVDGAVDVYLYQVDEDEIVRVSAPPEGGASYPCMSVANSSAEVLATCNGDLGVATSANGPTGVTRESIGLKGMRSQNLAEDAAGRFQALYFETRHSLAEGDRNGDRMDVYEWSDGRTSLISPGRADENAFYTGNSLDGRSVFFWTEESIDWREIDHDGDVYVARVGGGFSRPASPGVCLPLAGLCQGPGSAPVPVDPHTGRPGGGERAGSRVRLSIAVPGRRARARAARTGRIVLRVRTTSGGRLSLAARARIARRTVAVGRSTKRVKGAGTTTLRLTLGPAARRALRRGRGLKLALSVRQKGARERSITVRLRRTGS